MRITYYGHSCFALELAGVRLVTDPFIRPNPLASGVDFKKIEAEFILVTHGHEDHVADLVDLARQTKAQVVCSYEIYTWLLKKGIEKVHPMNIGGKKKFDFGQLRMVHAVHSSTLPDGTPGGSPAGYILHTALGSIYFAGDTALTMDMKLFGELYDLDLCFLPIGDNFTMCYKEAVLAADFVQCKKVIGMHYNTFGFIEIDTEEAKKAFKGAGKELFLPEIGETLEF